MIHYLQLGSMMVDAGSDVSNCGKPNLWLKPTCLFSESTEICSSADSSVISVCHFNVMLPFGIPSQSILPKIS